MSSTITNRTERPLITERKVVNAAQYEAQLNGYIAAARLSDRQAMIVRMHFHGAGGVEMRRALGHSEDLDEPNGENPIGDRDVRFTLTQAAATLARVIPDFWRPARQFPRHVNLAMRNSRVTDDPAVFTPTEESVPMWDARKECYVYGHLRMPSPRRVSAQDIRVEVVDALRLFHQSQQGAVVGA